MKTSRVGAVVLSVWAALNGLVALAVTVATLLGMPSPALGLVLTPAEVAAVDPRVVAVVNAQALFANPGIVAVCLMVLVCTWKGVLTRTPWVWNMLAASLLPLAAFGFVSDAQLGMHNIIANLGSSLMLVTGLALTYEARTSTNQPPPS